MSANTAFRIGLGMAAAALIACSSQGNIVAFERLEVPVVVDLESAKTKYRAASDHEVAVTEWYRLSVTSPDAPLVTASGVLEGQAEIQVPTGSGRIIEAEIHANENLDYLTWYGRSKPLTVEAGRSLTVKLDLRRTGENVPPDSDVYIPLDIYYTDSVIEAVVDVRDEDGDIPNVELSWYVDGVTVDGQSEASLDGEHFERDQAVHIVARVDDGTGFNEQVASNQVFIQNSPPVVQPFELDRTRMMTDAYFLSPPTATDADGDDITLTYEWYVDGELVDWSEDYLPHNFYGKNESVYAAVTAFDGIDYSDPMRSNVIYARPGGGQGRWNFK